MTTNCKNIKRTLATLLCTALLALSSGAAYALNTIKDVRTGQQNDGTALFWTVRRILITTCFCSTRRTGWSSTLRTRLFPVRRKSPKTRLISDFRVGNKPDIKGKRLVFDINNNVNIKKKFTIEPQAGQKNWRLVIDLSSQGCPTRRRNPT